MALISPTKLVISEVSGDTLVSFQAMLMVQTLTRCSIPLAGLPLTWNEVNSSLVVYVGQEIGAGWMEQQTHCLRSSSRLVTLSTKQEDSLFSPAMLDSEKSQVYSQFWLGLSFCKNNGGK